MSGIGRLLADCYRHAALQQRVADRAALADIEERGCALQLDGATWLDIRPMTDPREVPDHVADMARETLDYAAERGFIRQHPAHPHLVRVTWRPW